MAPVEDPGEEAEEICPRDDDGEAAQDVEPIKQLHSPDQPTDDQYECHRCDHYPYRTWCKYCVWLKVPSM